MLLTRHKGGTKWKSERKGIVELEHHVERGESDHQEQLYWYLPLHLMTVSFVRLLARHPVGLTLAVCFPFSNKWQCEATTNRGENAELLITKSVLQSKWICGTVQKLENEICILKMPLSGSCGYRVTLNLTPWNSEVPSIASTLHFPFLFHGSTGK